MTAMESLFEGLRSFDEPEDFEPFCNPNRLRQITSLPVAEAWSLFAEAAIITRPYYWINTDDTGESLYTHDHEKTTPPEELVRADELLVTRMQHHLQRLTESLYTLAPEARMTLPSSRDEIEGLTRTELLFVYDATIRAFLDICVNASITGMGINELQGIAMDEQRHALDIFNKPGLIVDEVAERESARYDRQA